MRTKEKDEAVAKIPLINDELRNPVYRGELDGLSVYTFEAKVRSGVFINPPKYVFAVVDDDLEVRRATGMIATNARMKFKHLN